MSIHLTRIGAVCACWGDGVVWRTPDTPENDAAFARTRHKVGEVGYPAGAYGLPNGTNQPPARRQRLRPCSRERDDWPPSSLALRPTTP